MAFRHTIGAGRFGEAYIQKLLEKSHLSCEPNPERSNKAKMIEWDLKVNLNGRPVLIETKFDQMEAKTGNIAIEYYNTKQGKPSGIAATKSDLWAVVLQNPLTAWLANTQVLLHYFKTTKCLRDIACGGDDNAAMKLYARDSILEAVFHRIDDLSSADLVSLLVTLVDQDGQNAPMLLTC